MSKLGTGFVVLAAFLLLAINARLLSRLGSLEEKLDQLSKTSPQGPRASAPPLPEEQESGSPARPSGEASRPNRAQPRRAETEAEPAAPAFDAATLPDGGGWKTVLRKPRLVPVEPKEISGLTDAQKRAIAELDEARWKEQLQLDGEHTVRNRDLTRRYDALVRACLSPEQQQRYDEQQRAAAPKRDGPLTTNVQSYVSQDPAPYDLEVEWHGQWWPARTVGVQGDLTLIHYVGHGKEWHEWVAPERVRPHQP